MVEVEDEREGKNVEVQQELIIVSSTGSRGNYETSTD